MTSLELSRRFKLNEDNKRYIKKLNYSNKQISFSVEKVSFFKNFVKNFKPTRKWVSNELVKKCFNDEKIFSFLLR